MLHLGWQRTLKFRSLFNYGGFTVQKSQFVSLERENNQIRTIEKGGGFSAVCKLFLPFYFNDSSAIKKINVWTILVIFSAFANEFFGEII